MTGPERLSQAEGRRKDTLQRLKEAERKRLENQDLRFEYRSHVPAILVAIPLEGPAEVIIVGEKKDVHRLALDAEMRGIQPLLAELVLGPVDDEDDYV